MVYKVDRLTRSLADFAKLVELFDAHGVSFVSVTQQFNTTTSMGRLTLNVLLSFAQFEREVTGERIRDKIGASKRKGLWVGGMVPLGYVSRDKKLFIAEDEAERVRTIFQRYLDLGSIGLLLADLRERGIVTKVRQLSDGRTVGGIPFTRGPLAYLLRNRFYIGEVVFRGQICPGEHPPILDRGLFEAVQRRLAEQHNGYHATAAGSEAVLTGRIFDDRGNRMSPSHSRKGGARYGYYVSSALIQGRPQSAGSVARVAAAKVEAVVFDAIRQHIGDDAPIDTTELITTCVRQIEVRRTEIAISLVNEDNASEDEQANPLVLTVPWSKTPHRRHLGRGFVGCPPGTFSRSSGSNQRLMPSGCGRDDFVSVCGPAEGLWYRCGGLDESVDRGLQIDDAAEDPPFEACLVRRLRRSPPPR